MNVAITPETKVVDLVDWWLERLRAESRLEITTINEYERVLRRLVAPELGRECIGLLTTERVNELLARLGVQSVNRQRKAKVVLGALLDAAVAASALQVNPVRGSLSISRPPASQAALSADEVARVQEAVRAWLRKERPGPRASRDMVDIIEVMLGTGARIGEVLALRWRDINLDLGIIEINATIKTQSGTGTYRKPTPRPRTVELPEDTALLLARHRRIARPNAIDAVFPTRNSTWQQVNNVERRWRQIRQDAGLDWVTPELFRRVALSAPTHER